MRLFLSAMMAGLVSLEATAIELGPIQLVSDAAEPFEARIAITDLGSTNPNQLLPGLAPQAEFERLGIPRIPELGELSFELVPGEGVAQVLVRSEQPIGDLALEFLLELYTPSGRVIKGYSVLFDPPVSAPVTLPIETDVALSGETIEVGGRTLWRVANDITPEGLTVDQVMIGLLRATPASFERQNINGLLSNSRLRLPTRAGYQQFDPAAAKAAVDAQHLAWDQQTGNTPLPGEALMAKPAVPVVPAPPTPSDPAVAPDFRDLSDPVITLRRSEYDRLERQLNESREALVDVQTVRDEYQSQIDALVIQRDQAVLRGDQLDQELTASTASLAASDEEVLTLERKLSEVQFAVSRAERKIQDLEQALQGQQIAPANNVSASNDPVAQSAVAPDPLPAWMNPLWGWIGSAVFLITTLLVFLLRRRGYVDPATIEQDFLDDSLEESKPESLDMREVDGMLAAALSEPEPEPEPEPADSDSAELNAMMDEIDSEFLAEAVEPESTEPDAPIESDSKLDYLSDPIDGGRYGGRLDLANTYVEMGMYQDAEALLGEVEQDGDDASKARAAELRQRIQDENGSE